MIELGLFGRTGVSLALDFAPCAGSMYGWLKQVDLNDGCRTDTTTEKNHKRRCLGRDNERLREERENLEKE